MSARAIPDETRHSQAQASQPDASAWVSANAGSGKTHVLTTRVIRLLLDGASPSSLLCLTFTKAAAANMSLRVFRTLSAWTGLSDEELRDEIVRTGTEFRPELLTTARRLFARTIEAPGGLKIQTIHSFCEAVLHLFPFEANVSASFEVIDDARRLELLALAKSTFLAQARGRIHTRDALTRLAGALSNFAFDALVDEALSAIKPDFTDNVASPDYPDRLRAALGLEAGEEAGEVERRIISGGLTREALAEIAVAIGEGSVKDREFARKIRALDALDEESRAMAYLDLFLKDGEPRGRSAQKLITKDLQKRNPGLIERLDEEADRLASLHDRFLAARTVERSQAIGVVVAGVLDQYAALKRRRGYLDFDDLIDRTARLFEDGDAQWVLYKLDSGINHILVDEAQDTSAPQWRILATLAAEFTSGLGARPAYRTFFAVGDEKQSIFSFQGAAPQLFDANRIAFHRRFEDAGKAFHKVNLNFSFRSSPGILAAVDNVFAIPDHRRGLSAEDIATVHAAWKSDVASHIELWPPVGPVETPEVADWRLPLDAPRHDEPTGILAERIAALVGRLLDPGSREYVHDDRNNCARPIHGGDVMILLRRRGALFEALIRALKLRGLPVAGADRMVLRDHIAVMDLIALGRYCLLPEDDLSLACVLKSPLFDFDDDDLLQIAPERTGSLHDALAGSSVEAHRNACKSLESWREQAPRLTPRGFYSAVLDEGGGRARFLARLGAEAGDALDEFVRLAIQTESEGAPSLLRFLHHVEAGDLVVKRDMEAAGASIRVMTVHAAKGLESKVVILPDTCSKPSHRFDPKMFSLEDRQGRQLLAWSPRAAEDCARVAQERERNRSAMMAEYRRLLYVALTRAEERLYVMGHHDRREPADDCWYNMIRRSLEPQLEPCPAEWNAGETIWRVRREDSNIARFPAIGNIIEKPMRTAIPDWLFRRVDPAPDTEPVLRPSHAPDDELREPAEMRRPAQSPAARRGLAIHALLQTLPALAADERSAAGRSLLAAKFRELAANEAGALVAQAIEVIQDERLAPFFTRAAQAEVSVAGRLSSAHGEIGISGRIDRLAEVGAELWFADFKSGDVNDPARYAGQLALYSAALNQAWPDRPVRAFLVGVDGPMIFEFSPDELRSRLDALIAAAVDQADQSAP